jgi:hypothetical protein
MLGPIARTRMAWRLRLEAAEVPVRSAFERSGAAKSFPGDVSAVSHTRERVGAEGRRAASAVMAAALLLGGCGLLGGGRPVETPQQVAERTADDTRIQREVEARLAAEPSIGAGRLRVEVRRGEVSVHGGAPGFGALQCALRNAELVRGVHLVIDMTVLEKGPSTVQCLAPRVFGGAASGSAGG